VTDGERVYAWFSNGQLVALDMTGKRSGHGSSDRSIPSSILTGVTQFTALYQDRLILLCFENSSSYLLALDKRTCVFETSPLRQCARHYKDAPVRVSRHSIAVYRPMGHASSTAKKLAGSGCTPRRSLVFTISGILEHPLQAACCTFQAPFPLDCQSPLTGALSRASK